MPKTAIALFLVLLLLPGAVAAYDTLERGEGGLTAFDIMQLLVERDEPIDKAFIDELFTTGVMANMNIPSEHVRVAFYDANTGRRMDRHAIRELVGDTPHDGMTEMFFMAEGLVPGGLPMEVSQLVALMDASYVSSMRNPPNIDVEFYDARCGPKGRLGGGVSGYTPREPCIPGGQVEVRVEEDAEPETSSHQWEHPVWGTLDSRLVVRRSLDERPRSEAAYMARLEEVLEPETIFGQTAKPFVLRGRTPEEIEEKAVGVIEGLDEQGYQLGEHPVEFAEIYDDDMMVYYVYVYVHDNP